MRCPLTGICAGNGNDAAVLDALESPMTQYNGHGAFV